MQTSSNLQSKRTGLPEPTAKIDSKSTSGSEKKQAQPDAQKAEAMEKVLDAMSAEKKAVEAKSPEAKAAESPVKDQKIDQVTDETARLSIEDKPTAESAKAVNVDPAADKSETADASHDAASDAKSSAKKRTFDQVCNNVQMVDETGAVIGDKSAEPLAAEEKKEADQPIADDKLASPTKRMRVEQPNETSDPALMQASAPVQTINASAEPAVAAEASADKVDDVAPPSMVKDIPVTKVQEAMFTDAEKKQDDKVESKDVAADVAKNATAAEPVGNETAKFAEEKQVEATQATDAEQSVDKVAASEEKPEDLEQAYMDQVAGAPSQEVAKGDADEKK